MVEDLLIALAVLLLENAYEKVIEIIKTQNKKLRHGFTILFNLGFINNIRFFKGDHSKKYYALFNIYTQSSSYHDKNKITMLNL